MALKACKECGKEVSSQAKACPHCGAPPPRGSGFGWVLLVLLVLIPSYFVFVDPLINPPSTDSANSPTETLEKQPSVEKVFNPFKEFSFDPATQVDESNGNTEVLGFRRSRDGVNIRRGPGTNYPVKDEDGDGEEDGDGQLVLGEKLHILERRGDWLRFRVTPYDIGWSGWVRRDLALSEAEYQRRKDELWKEFYRSQDHTVKEKLDAARAATAEGEDS